MRKNRALAGVLAALACAAGMTAAAAAPAAAGPAKGAVAVQNTQVTAWADYGVYRNPNNGSEKLSYVTPGGTYDAMCWTPGQKVTVGNVTNHIWIKIDRTWPRDNGYVPAAALQGDAHANVPNQC
ncbi:hypothetical protein [Streptomyces sp. ODS28]|uniref:hypothetical protein n=1 Tax=Streptomyces sp. ODS28 TaxID=3136688 RepID=UPI0031EC82EE